MRHGKVMEVKHLRAVQGIPDFVTFESQTDTSARMLLGNQMHVADVGVVTGIAVLLSLGALPKAPTTEAARAVEM